MKTLIKGSMLACMIMANSLAVADNQPYFGGEADVAFANSLWQTLTKNRWAGPEAINVFPFRGNQPHGAIQQVTDSMVSVDGRSGRVVVKRNHGGEGADPKTVYADPEKYLKAVTVMYKRESGYDKENQDWFWAKYSPNGKIDKNPKGVSLAGRVGKGASAGCIAFHKAIGGEDLETLTLR